MPPLPSNRSAHSCRTSEASHLPVPPQFRPDTSLDASPRLIQVHSPNMPKPTSSSRRRLDTRIFHLTCFYCSLLPPALLNITQVIHPHLTDHPFPCHPATGFWTADQSPCDSAPPPDGRLATETSDRMWPTGTHAATSAMTHFPTQWRQSFPFSHASMPHCSSHRATPRLVQPPPNTMHRGTPSNRATADTDGSGGAVAQPRHPGRHGTTAA